MTHDSTQAVANEEAADRAAVGVVPLESVAFALRASLRNRPVLVVVQDADRRESLAGRLAAWSLPVEWAGDALTARAKWDQAQAERRPFGLLIVAPTLPDQDGADFVRQIRKTTRRRVPTILLETEVQRPAGRPHSRPLRNAVRLPSPVTDAELLQALCQALARPSSPRTRKVPSPGPAAPPSPSRPEVFDLADAMARAGGSQDRLRKGVKFYFDEAPLALAQIRAGMDRRDASAVARAAHRLTGTLVYLAARSALQAARRVDELGVLGDLGGVAAAIVALEGELATLEQALQPYRAAGADGR